MARRTSHDELYAAVYANPDDDGPRTVLADALQEAGDPRGEFIALQLARASGGKKTRRESQLLKPNLGTWTGPISIAMSKRVFERGFVARCQLQHHRESIEPHLNHREWATVVEVTTGRWSGSMQAFGDALTHLRVLNTEHNAGILPSHPRLEKINVKYIFEQRDAEHLATLKLPSLREWVSSYCYPKFEELKPFLDSLKSLQRLSVGVVSDPEPWIRWIAKRSWEGASVSMAGPWALWFEGKRITAQYLYGGHEQRSAGRQLAELLEHVPAPSKWDVTVMQVHSWQGTSVAAIKRGVGGALKKFNSYVIEESSE